MILHMFHKRQNGMALNQQPIINKKKSHPSQIPYVSLQGLIEYHQ